MIRAGQFVRVISIAALMLPVASAVGITIWHAQGGRLLSVQSASMVPAFRPGDALLIRPVQVQELQAGDIVSYRSPQNPRMVISHRLINIDIQRDRLITSGDTAQNPDSPVLPTQVIGKVVAVAPGLGSVLDTVRHPVGLLTMVYLPGGLVISAEITRFRQHYRQPTYLLDYNHGSKS